MDRVSNSPSGRARAIVCAAFFSAGIFSAGIFGQPVTVDIHLSPPDSIPEMRRSFSSGGRFELRNATLVDLIHTAWSVDAGNVMGGPDWVDTRRFDVTATTTPATLTAVLQALLKDRFQLSVHTASRDLPAYAITAGKKLQLKQAEGSGNSGCVQQDTGRSAPRGAPQPPVAFACANMTMAAFASALPGIREASGYLLNHPVLDRTGLTGAWDFSLSWSPRNVFLPAPSAGEELTLFDAFEKQLGLKLSLIKIPTPAVVIDKVTQPALAPPPQPHLEFEVADIRPDDPNDPAALRCGYIDVQPGGRVRINMSLRGLLLETQGDFDTHRIAIGFQDRSPKFIDETCWQILAKAPAQQDAALGLNETGWNGPVWNGVDIGVMRTMLRSLLEDRFKLVVHTENRPVPGYALIAVKPKLRKADPANRSGCKEGPGPDGKDPRSANPLASRLVTCLNTTLAEFAAELNLPGTGTGAPVVDATGIDGRCDITINFSPPSAFLNGPPAAPANDAIATEPSGAISIFEAIRTQLGLKLQSREVPTPVLVVDHIEEKPPGN